jgi:erythromycin esterase-like protein
MDAYSREMARYSHALTDLSDLDDLMSVIKDKRIVMLGESSHGTSEFYQWRKVISLELIKNHQFDFIAVEGDWPACQKLNHFIQTQDEGSILELLKVFDRWPTWMWANMEIEDLLFELKLLKTELKRKIGFHGLDVYSLMESVQELKKILPLVDSSLFQKYFDMFSCFENFHFNEKEYTRSLFGDPEGCQKEVENFCQEILHYELKDPLKKDELFEVIQNAHVIKNAQHYYRSMISIDDQSWNIRDQHMMETLMRLTNHYGPSSKGIVWAHNTHIGDYRGTDMVLRGEVNLGGLAKKRYGEHQVSLIGLGTFSGTVMASHAWEGPSEVLPLPEARPQSLEYLMHNLSLDTLPKNFYVLLNEAKMNSALLEFKGHRAIGVVYHPESDRKGHYVPTSLPKRYDGFIFLDETHPLTPIKQGSDRKKFPDSFPFGARI